MIAIYGFHSKSIFWKNSCLKMLLTIPLNKLPWEIAVLERNVRIANATKRAKTLFRLGLEGKDPVVRNYIHRIAAKVSMSIFSTSF